jgi:hypothetical protein
MHMCVWQEQNSMFCTVMVSCSKKFWSKKYGYENINCTLRKDYKKQSAHFAVGVDISCLSQAAALMRCETEDTSHTVSIPAFQRRHGTMSHHTATGTDVMDNDKLTSPELQQGRISCRTVRVKYDVPRTVGGRTTSLTGEELRGRTGHVFNSRQCHVAALERREKWPEAAREIFHLLGCYAAWIGS